MVLAATDLSLAYPGCFCFLSSGALPLDVPPLVSVVIAFLMMGLLEVAGFGARHLRFRARRSDSDFLLLARSTGCKPARLLWAPRSAKPAPAFLRAIFISIPLFILTEANLSILGLGVMEPMPSWGKFDARFRGFLHALAKSLEAGAPGTARHRGHVFSTDSSNAGGHTVMRRVGFFSVFNCLVLACFRRPHKLPSSPAANFHFCLRGEPKTFNPLLVEDGQSETVRYLTGGVLIRLNRQTQASRACARHILESHSRRSHYQNFISDLGLHFSDGTPFTSEDVAYTVKAFMDPQLHSPTGDSFRFQ